MSSPDRELRPGTVSRIAQQKKRPDRVSIYIDGAFAFGVHRDVLLGVSLRSGALLSVELQRRMLEDDERIRARMRALDLIAYRPRSRAELTRRLDRDGFSPAASEAAVARMAELGYLDDRAYALEYAASRLRNKAYGPRRIRHELLARGIDRGLTEEVLQAVFHDPDDLLVHARAAAEKYQRRLEREPDPVKRRKKLYDALVRRGFSGSTIRRVVEEFAV